MADLNYTPITPSGIDDATLTAADAAGDSFPADNNKLFRVLNGDASPHTVTIGKPSNDTVCGNLGKIALSDIVITIPAGESRLFTLPTGYAGSDGKFTLTYDDVTSVTVGGFSIAVNG